MGEQECIKASRREDEGVGRSGKMENAADCVLAEPDRHRRRGREVGIERNVCKGACCWLFQSVATTNSESWASAKKGASQQLELSPGSLEDLCADFNLLVEILVLVPAR